MLFYFCQAFESLMADLDAPGKRLDVELRPPKSAAFFFVGLAAGCCPDFHSSPVFKVTL